MQSVRLSVSQFGPPSKRLPTPPPPPTPFRKSPHEHLQKLFDRNRTHIPLATLAHNHRRNQIKYKYPDYTRNKRRVRSKPLARLLAHTRTHAHSSPRKPPRVFSAHVYIATVAVACLCHRRRRRSKQKTRSIRASVFISLFVVHDAVRGIHSYVQCVCVRVYACVFVYQEIQ